MLRPTVRSTLPVEAWRRIPARDRLTLALLFYEGLTPTEAARALGCPVREVIRIVEAWLGRLGRSIRPGGRVARSRPRVREAAEPRRRAA